MTGVIIRGPMGRSGIDPKLGQYHHDAGQAGLQRGMYGLWRPIWTPQEQAAHFFTVWASYQWELPPAVDIEIPPEPFRNVANEIHEYLVDIENRIGMKPVIYTAAWFWDTYVGPQDWAKEYPLWAAGYPNPQHQMHPPERWPAYYAPAGWPATFPHMWQFTTIKPGADWGVESAALDLNWRKTNGR